MGASSSNKICSACIRSSGLEITAVCGARIPVELWLGRSWEEDKSNALVWINQVQKLIQ
jgi:hypothetical protein